MDIKQRKNILSHLARKAGDDNAALEAVQKEVKKITEALKTETQYDHISDQLELLDTIAYRVHKETVDVIRNLLKVLASLELTYQEVLGCSSKQQREYYNKNTLVIKALEVLEHIRYHQPEAILSIFFEYSSNTEEVVKKQAIDGLEALAGYDLDIFYGNGKDWPGLGWEPQDKVLEKIASLDNAEKITYLSGIIAASHKILSPAIKGTHWDYKSVNIRTGAVPAMDGVKEIRQKTLIILQELYPLVDSFENKKAIIGAMDSATHTPHMGKYGDDVLAMIVADTITVVKFMARIVSSENEDMQIMQKIEHEAYWLFYHKHTLDPDISKITLEIRDILYAHEEYKIFRILIGFESIFHEWKKDKKERDDYDQEKKFRESEALRLAIEITDDTYTEWKERIIRYASIKSNDMATFPYFGEFLEHFAKSSPALALQLLSEASDEIEGFLVAILHGVSKTEQKNDVYEFINTWCDQGKYLFTLARFFEFSLDVDDTLLKKIMDKANESDDLNTLSQIIASVSAQYNDTNKHLVKDVFIPALAMLTAHKNSGWIFGFWFRKQRGEIVAAMNASEHKAIIDNLFSLSEIDSHAEEILCEIAKQSPILIIEFFCNRLAAENDDEQTRYEAIPFSFHTLSEPLSVIPEQAVDIVLETYDENYGLFIYRGARLLKSIFPDLPQKFEQKLIQIIQTKEENNLMFVMAILRNYDGNQVIHAVCKELVKVLPEDSKLLNEVTIILQNTGVVSGEYGFVEAYRNKIDGISSWLEGTDSKVQLFAKEYVASLENQIEYEQKRADENIMLRKHQYGDES